MKSQNGHRLGAGTGNWSEGVQLECNGGGGSMCERTEMELKESKEGRIWSGRSYVKVGVKECRR